MEDSIGKRIKKLRKELKLTQGDLAGEKLSRAMLSLIERDLNAPSLRTVEYLSSKLGVSVGYLLGEDPITKDESSSTVNLKKNLDICRTLYNVKKFKEAERRLKEILEIGYFPEKWLAHKLLGQIYEKTNKNTEALIHFKESLCYLSSSEINEMVEIYYYITFSNSKIENYKDAIQAALKASALINSNYHGDIDCILVINILYLHALCYCRIGEYDKGLEVICQAKWIMETNNVAYSNGHFYMLKGVAELYMHKYPEGIASTKIALKYLDPKTQKREYFGSKVNLGILLRKQNKLVQSLQVLHDSLDESLAMDYKEMLINNYYELSLSYLSIDDIILAEYFIRYGLEEVEPKSYLHAQCHYILGKVCMKKGQYREALYDFNTSEAIFQMQKNDSWLALIKAEKAVCYEMLEEHNHAFQTLLEANQHLISKDMKLISLL